MGRNITEPGDKTLKSCNFNDILRLESVRDIPRVTISNSRGMINTVHLTAVIKYYISSSKGGEMIKLTNPDRTRKYFCKVKNGEKHKTFPIKIGAENQD